MSLVGGEYARAEELELGEILLKEIREQADMGNPQQRSMVHRLEGELELARGNHPRAIDLLLRAEREHSRALTLESLANAYLTAGDMEKGIANYETLIGRNPAPFGIETQQRWLAARYRLAKAYHSLGMNAKAQEHLDFFLNMWSDADNDVPLLQEALRLRKEM